MLESLDSSLQVAEQVLDQAGQAIREGSSSRRGFIGGVVGGAVALALAGKDAKPTQAQSTMVRAATPWNLMERDWHPLSEEGVRAHPGTSLIHRDRGVLWIIDEAHNRFYNQPSQSRQYEAESSAQALAENPGLLLSAGFCREMALVGLMEEEPNDIIVPELAGLVRPGPELRAFKVGALMAIHTSTPWLRIGSKVENDSSAVDQVLRTFPHQNIVVDAPGAGMSGQWFRVLYGLSANQFLGTNFGAEPIPLSRNLIHSAQIPPSIDDDVNIIYGQVVGGSNLMRAKYAQLRSQGKAHTNPELNYNFVRYLVYGGGTVGLQLDQQAFAQRHRSLLTSYQSQDPIDVIQFPTQYPVEYPVQYPPIRPTQYPSTKYESDPIRFA